MQTSRDLEFTATTLINAPRLRLNNFGVQAAEFRFQSLDLGFRRHDVRLHYLHVTSKNEYIAPGQGQQPVDQVSSTQPTPYQTNEMLLRLLTRSWIIVWRLDIRIQISYLKYQMSGFKPLCLCFGRLSPQLLRASQPQLQLVTLGCNLRLNASPCPDISQLKLAVDRPLQP